MKTLQLEQMAVVGHAEEPSVVASRMRLVFTTLEVSSMDNFLLLTLFPKQHQQKYAMADSRIDSLVFDRAQCLGVRKTIIYRTRSQLRTHNV